MPRAEVSAPPSTTPAVVIDNGSGTVKAGFAGEDDPRVLLAPSALGVAPPFRRGIVNDWDAMEAVWEQAFAQLKVNAEETNILCTSPLFDPKENKERLMQSMFETFGAPGVWTCPAPVFELYAAGRENGVVVGSGAQGTYAVCIHEGLPDPRTMVRSEVAGDALTLHTQKVLQQCAGASAGAVDLATAKRAKETIGLCAPGPNGALPEGVKDSLFELPDGKKIKVPVAQRCAIGEAIFEPSLVGVHEGGLAGLAAEAIRLRDRDGALESTEHGKDGTDNWYASVVLAGGSTMFPNIDSRLTHELARKAPTPMRPVVHAPPERGNAAWIGGSILASLAVSGQIWISKEEYDENGPLIVHRKCF